MRHVSASLRWVFVCCGVLGVVDCAGAALPTQATLTRDKLTPKLTKPVNTPHARSLPEQASKAMAEAKVLRQEGKASAAVAKLERALGFDPANPMILQLLGLTYVQARNLGKAAENLSKAAETQGDDIKIQLLLGRLAVLRKKPAEAMRRYRLALLCSAATNDSPQRGYALLQLSKVLMSRGYWTASLECLDELAAMLDAHGESFQKDPILSKLVINPEVLHGDRGKMLFLLGKTTESIPLLKKAYRRDKSQWKTGQLLVEAMLRAKQIEQAESIVLSLAGNADAASAVPAMAAAICKASQDAKKPMALWTDYREVHPVNGPLAIALANSAVEQGRSADALTILDDLLTEAPDSPKAMGLVTKILCQQKRFTEALDRLAKRIDGFPSKSSRVIPSARMVTERAGDDAMSVVKKYAEHAKNSTERYVASQLCTAGLLTELVGETDSAITLYEAAIAKKKDDRLSYEALLRIYQRRNQASKIAELYETARQSDADGSFAWYIKGCAHVARGQLSQAIDALEEASSRSLNDATILIRLADVYQLQATRYAVRHEKPNLVTLYRQRAQDALKKALEVAPDSPETMQSLFEQYRQSGKLDLAREMAEKLTEQYPDQADGLMLQCKLYLQEKKFSKAAMIALQLGERFEDRVEAALLAVEVDLARARGILSKVVFERVMKRLQKLRRRYRNHPLVIQTMARVLTLPVPDMRKDAASLWGIAYRRSQENPKFGWRYAIALLKAKEGTEAARVLKKLLSTDPGNQNVQSAWTEAMIESDEMAAAVAEVEKWLEGDPENPRYLMMLLKLYKKSKKYEKALTLLEGVTNRRMSRWVARERVDVLFSSGDLAGAIEHARQKDQLKLLVYLLLEQKKYTQTITMLDKVAGAMQEDDLWDQVMLECLAKTNQMDRFNKVAAAFIAKSPQEPKAYAMVSIALQASEKMTEAVSRLKKWRSEVEDGTIKSKKKRAFLSALNSLEASVYLEDQDWTALDAFMKKTVQNDPNNTKLLMTQATLLGEQGKPAEALKVMRRALKLRGDDALVNNNLAYMMCEANEDLATAEKMVRTSLAAQFSIAATDTLAWVLYKKGAFNEAALLLVAILEQADRPEVERQLHPIIWDHAGDALYRLGWNERAKTYWTRALDDGKTLEENTREMREMLKNVPLKLKALAEGQPVPVTPTAPKTKMKTKTNEPKK